MAQSSYIFLRRLWVNQFALYSYKDQVQQSTMAIWIMFSVNFKNINENIFPILIAFAVNLTHILGVKWQAAGTFAQIIAPWVAISFVFRHFQVYFLFWNGVQG